MSRVLVLLATTIAAALTLAFAPLPASAHTRLYYYPLQATIRNAETRQGDGAFSVAGVCGGVRRWANRGFTNVNNGQRVCARVNWNGGHKVRENRWKALFRCQRPDQEIDIQNAPQLPFVAGTNPAPEPGNMTVAGAEANGVWDGYTVCVDLPMQDLTFQANDEDIVRRCDNPARACTLSITDQRNWGGCLDLCLRDNYTDLVPRTTLAPSDPRLYAPISVPQAEGVYRVVDCDASSGGKCCLEGFVAVTKEGKVGARLRGNSGQSNCFDLQYYGWQDYQFTMRAVPFTNSSFQGNFFMSPGWNGLNYWFDPQNISLTITVTDSGATMNLVNVGLDAPVVSDHTFTYYTTIEQGVSLSYVPYPTGESPFQLPFWGYIAIIGGVLAIYFVGGVIANRCCGDRKCRHPHIHTCLVSFGCVARDKRKALEPEFKGFSVHLPLNWETAVDPGTGEPYYYNTVTKEVTWVRPKPE